MRNPLLLLGITLLLAACAAPPTLRTAKIVPARVPDPARPRQLLVAPLAGDRDGAFTAALVSALTGISLDGHPYFALTGRDTSSAPTAAREGAGDPLTDAEAVALGRAAAAAGVLTGSVMVEYEERQPRERRTVCLKADDDGGCVRWGDAPVSCTQREARIIFSPRLVVTEGGRISYAKSIRVRSSADACTDGKAASAGREELTRTVGELALKELRKDIAPYFVTTEAPVMTTSEGIPSGEARDLFIQGLLAAGENRPDRACDLWEKAGRFTATAPGLRYDLGVCRELAGELEQALAEYQKAEELLRSPDETVSNALARVRKEIATRSRIAGEAAR